MPGICADTAIPVVADAPEVGQNLQDHLDYTAHIRMNGPGLFGYGPMATLRAPRHPRPTAKGAEC